MFLSERLEMGEKQFQNIAVAAAVLNQTALDLDGNTHRIISAIENARDQGFQIVCMPELCLTGYGCEDQFLSSGFCDDALQAVSRIAAATDSMVTCVGLPLRYQSQPFNVCALIADGRILGFVAKQHLAREGLHYEPRWFRPWQIGHVVTIKVDGKEVPLGDLVFELDGIRLGFEICEDAWVENRPAGRLARRGVDLILNPSASHFAFGKNRVRQQLIIDATQEYGLSYVYANLLGNEAGRAIYDGDAYLAKDGRILKSGPRFSYRDWFLTGDVLSFSGSESLRAPDMVTGMDDVDRGLVRSDFTWKETPLEVVREATETSISGELDWENSKYIKEEEFSRSVSLGLFDYVRKSRSRGVVVSLSGGADSAAVVCLSRLMLEFAQAELRDSGLSEKLDYLDFPESFFKSEDSDSIDPLADFLILTAYQATTNSSEVTRAAAKEVAQGCGTHHVELDIENLVNRYTTLISNAIGRELSWETDDITLQNIQARTRSPSIWMFANIRNALLLSTSNRSEAAVGYATMDGDTSGGLAPVAGIDKAFLMNWLGWLETTGPQGMGSRPFLNGVNRQLPTAELRPMERNQTDEDDLMPYTVLDFIERAAVRDKKMPREIVELLAHDNPTIDRVQIVSWIRRFFQLWCRNQWKRERYAPSFHLDDESLDPKTWCRFPILSGGFVSELNSLQ